MIFLLTILATVFQTDRKRKRGPNSVENVDNKNTNGLLFKVTLADSVYNMGPKKRWLPVQQEKLEDSVAKRARIEESDGWMGVNEHSFIAVKPDGVHRRLVGEIIQRFEKKGFRLVGMKLVQASEDLLREHYWDLRDKPFFNGLVRYMSSGPIVAMVWQGLDVVKISRKMLGETNPADSLPGTIRGDYSVEVGRNVIHGSDSVESAQREISLWFRPNELQCWEDSSGHWIYE